MLPLILACFGLRFVVLTLLIRRTRFWRVFGRSPLCGAFRACLAVRGPYSGREGDVWPRAGVGSSSLVSWRTAMVSPLVSVRAMVPPLIE